MSSDMPESAVPTGTAVDAAAAGGIIEGKSPWQLAWRRLRRDKVGIASAVVIVLLVVLALGAPLIAQWLGHPYQQQYPKTGLGRDGLPVGPGKAGFILGTDEIGRDIFVRVAYGAQISLFVGIVATLIATAVGVALGLIAGYFGGVVDVVLSRLMDAVLSFPYVLFAIALVSVFGSSLAITIAVIAFFSWAAVGRVVRGQTLSIKEKEYVEAARSLGAGDFRIMFIDILPNLIAPVIVLGTLLIPSAIVFEATLSYLGLGVPLPTPTWGNMLSDSQTGGVYTVAWWFWFFPGLALLVTTLAFNLLGDSVRDALDPRTERVFAAAGKRR